MRLSTVIVAGVCLLVGSILGYKLGTRYNPDTPVALSLQQAGQTMLFVTAADRLHAGDTNSAMRLLVGQVDFGLASLGMDRDLGRISPEGLKAFEFALEYRRTNSWMAQFESPSSGITANVNSLLQKQ